VKKLLDKGASVDVCSDTGDTPLLASVIQMSKNKLDSVGESDDRFFMLLSKYKHKSETVNQRTSKKRLTPLMSAIDAGRVDVVQKLLDMGAEVDRKASADDMTPLYYCIQLIKRLETPDEFKYKLKEASKNPEINKELRRWGVNHLPNSPLIEGFIGDLIDNVTPLSEVDPKEIEKIALLLLENGANPNCEHNITGSNSTLYTPLMLAAEEDNAFLFEKMLDFGGDIQKRAKYSTRTPSDDDIEGICKYFSSKKVIRLLRQRKESSS
jgi:ankyrin repeat protein